MGTATLRFASSSYTPTTTSGAVSATTAQQEEASKWTEEQQEAASRAAGARSPRIGDGLPYVFCSRSGERGGVWFEVPIAKSRYTWALADDVATMGVKYYGVISTGQISTASVTPFYGGLPQGSGTLLYSQPCPFTPGNLLPTSDDEAAGETEEETEIVYQTDAAVMADGQAIVLTSPANCIRWEVNWSGSNTGYKDETGSPLTIADKPQDVTRTSATPTQFGEAFTAARSFKKGLNYYDVFVSGAGRVVTAPVQGVIDWRLQSIGGDKLAGDGFEILNFSATPFTAPAYGASTPSLTITPLVSPTDADAASIYVVRTRIEYLIPTPLQYTAQIYSTIEQTVSGGSGASITPPQAPEICGDANGTFSDLTCLSFSIELTGEDIASPQGVACFIDNGAIITRVNGATGSSSSFADLMYHRLLNEDKVPSHLINLSSFQAADVFLQTNNLHYDGIIFRSENTRQLIERDSLHQLLFVVQAAGRWELRPRVPTDNAGAISTAALTSDDWTALTLDDFVAGSFQVSDVPAQDREPTQYEVQWRQELVDEPPRLETVTYSYPSTTPTRIKNIDLSRFCTSSAHAKLVAQYLASQQYFVTKVMRGSLVPSAPAIAIGDILETTITRWVEGVEVVETDYWQVKEVRWDSDGGRRIACDEFPLDGSNQPLISLGIVNPPATLAPVSIRVAWS